MNVLPIYISNKSNLNRHYLVFDIEATEPVTENTSGKIDEQVLARAMNEVYKQGTKWTFHLRSGFST